MRLDVHHIFGIETGKTIKQPTGSLFASSEPPKVERKYFHELAAAQKYQEEHPECAGIKIKQYNAVQHAGKWSVFPAYSAENASSLKFYDSDLLPNHRADGSFRVNKQDCWFSPESKKMILSHPNNIFTVKFESINDPNFDAKVMLTNDPDARNQIYVDVYQECYWVDVIDNDAKLEDRPSPGLPWDDTYKPKTVVVKA